MRCPFCGSDALRVLETRDGPDGVHRRRRCETCNRRFGTNERIELGRAPMIIKRDGRREPFDRDKLIRNVRKACEKRPLPVGEVERLVDDIEQDILQQSRLEVSSRAVGDMTMDRLLKLDPIAYIRFASVYLNFEGLDDLLRLAERIRHTDAGEPQAPPATPA